MNFTRVICDGVVTFAKFKPYAMNPNQIDLVGQQNPLVSSVHSGFLILHQTSESKDEQLLF